MSSDDEPLVSAARNVVARVCTQIDDESSRMVPSTVPATPVTLARVTGERAPIDALEDDLSTHCVHCVERGHMDPSLVVQGDPSEDQLVRWIDMSRGDEEESVEDQRPAETTLQVGCEGGSALLVNSDHPTVWCWSLRQTLCNPSKTIDWFRIGLRVILVYICVKPQMRLYVCHRVGPFWVYFGSTLGPS